MQWRERSRPTEEEVDRRMRVQRLAARRQAEPRERSGGHVVPQPGFIAPMRAGSSGFGRDPLDEPDPHARPALSWRSELAASGLLNVLLGLWLAVSPLVLGYEDGDPARHDAIAGVAIAAIAATRLSTQPWVAGLGWLNAALGMWLVAAAFWLAESTVASWNEAIVGALVAILAALAGSATDRARRAARR